jgi:hypothetical protein
MAIFKPGKDGTKTAMPPYMTRFSMVSSIQDDSLGSKHLPGDI